MMTVTVAAIGTDGDREAPAPVCQNCGMRHAPEDTGACIEGHGDDPSPDRAAKVTGASAGVASVH
jgi:hypothetical protein